MRQPREFDASVLSDRHTAYLLDLVAGGDECALARLYDRIATRVYRHFHEAFADPARAATATHSIFVEIWSHAPRYRSSGSAATAWIAQLVRSRTVA